MYSLHFSIVEGSGNALSIFFTFYISIQRVRENKIVISWYTEALNMTKNRAGVPTKHATYQIATKNIFVFFKGKGRCGRVGLG